MFEHKLPRALHRTVRIVRIGAARSETPRGQAPGIGLQGFQGQRRRAQGLEQARGRIEHCEVPLQATETLAGAQEQHAVDTQGVLKTLQHPFLQLGFEIDQGIATGDHIHLGKRRIADHVVPGKDHRAAQLRANAQLIATARKSALEALFADLRADRLGVGAGGGHVQIGLLQIGGEDLQFDDLAGFAQALVGEYGDAVGLFARRATGHPDAQRLAATLVVDDLAHRDFQRFEGLGVAKEAGDPDQRFAAQRVEFIGLVAQHLQIGRQRSAVLERHAPLDAAGHRGSLVLVEGNARAQLEFVEHIAKRYGAGELVAVALRQRDVAVAPHGVLADAGGELGRIAHRVDKAGGDGRVGHAVELRALWALRQRQTAGGVDLHHAAHAVAARAREHDGHHMLVVKAGGRGDEHVDGQVDHARGLCSQAEGPLVAQVDIEPRRDEIDLAGLDARAVFDGGNGQRRVTAQQFAHHAFVIGREMLNDHESAVLQFAQRAKKTL